MKSYTALTIGPIYQTITEAKRSRAKWAASYFFSWFNKQVLAKVKAKGIKALLPADDKIYKTNYGSGLYADRLYFITNDKAKIEGIVNVVKKEIAEDIEKHTKQTNVITFLNQYLNIHILKIDLTNYQFKEGEFTLSVLNRQLDQAELKQNLPFKYNENPLQAYFQLKIATNDNQKTLLVEDAFMEGGRYFQSMAEITAATLLRLNAPEFATTLYESFSKEDFIFLDKLIEESVFKHYPHHKYYAILYADGDNIGKLLQALNKSNKEKELKEFSTALFEFGEKTDQTIYYYGGNGIFLGGEDILAFCPLACYEDRETAEDKDKRITKTIFQLIKEIDHNWKQTVQKIAIENNIAIPTLSYGIQIAYHKYPLKEAMTAAHQLMDEAKNTKKHPCKNTIGISFRKHSGQTMKAFIEKSKTCSYENLVDFISKKCREIEYKPITENKTVKSTNERLLSGMMHRLQDATFQILLEQSIKTQNLDAFFENSFNEQIHKDNKTFMDDLKTLLKKTFNDYSEEKAFKIVYLILRLTHFINAKTDSDA